jgi:hypothetical protein
MMNAGFIFSLIAAVVTLGGLAVAFGVLKQKIAENAKVNDSQGANIEKCSTKQDLSDAIRQSDEKLAQAIQRSDEKLSAAIKRSDDLLAFMQKRAEEDRARGDGQYKELYGIINVHGERIASLETSQTQLFKTLDKLESTVSNGFRELRQEMKELRDSVNGRV